MSRLHELLLESDKKSKIFNFDNTPSIGYPSGLFPLDYTNAYWVRVNNKGNDKIPNRWLNLGTQGGSFYTIIGNSGVAKTTLAVQMGSVEVRPFEQGSYYHIDAEGTSNPTRVQVLNRYTDDEMESKYFFPEIVYVEDTFTLIYKLAQIKINDKSFAYHTGYHDSRGNEIIIPEPTVILIDSLPSLQTKDVEDSDQLGTQTYNMRLAIAYNTFYKRLRPIIRNANITVMAINHLKEKPEMGFVKTQAKIQYLKPNENIPGGSGPIYYSQNLLRMIYRGKFVEEKDGFNGFVVEAVNIKSKTNESGTSVQLVFNAKTGFDPMLTMLRFADNLGLVQGRNPYCFFKSDPDFKFSTKNIDFIMNDEKFARVLLAETQPYLMNMVGEGVVSNDNDMNPVELMNRMNVAYAIQEVDKDALVGDVAESEVRAAANRVRLSVAPKEEFETIKSKHLFEGIHHYTIGGMNSQVKVPVIEKYINSESYLNHCLWEMHQIPPEWNYLKEMA